MTQKADDVTMAALGFAPAPDGGYTRIGETPEQPGEAIRQALKEHGMLEDAAREAEEIDGQA